MLKPLHIILPLFAIYVLPARAQGPSFDCSKATGPIEKMICKDVQLSALDREIARLFTLAHDGKSANERRRAELVAEEKKWIAFRNNCHKAKDTMGCTTASYVEHIHKLRQGYADARSNDASGISNGPLGVRCENFDALLEVTFVSTDPPVAWVEWLNQGFALTLVPSGSGAKYESNTAKGLLAFWAKGDEALLDMPDGKSYTCKIGEIG